jgi:MFS family permease
LYAPVAILYFAKVTGSYALGMSIFSVSMVVQALMELPTGMFSDLVGRAKTVMLGSVAMLVGTVLFAIGGSYWWLFAGALFEGVSRAFYSGNNDALLHDTLVQLQRPNEYAEKLGRLSSLFQVALAVAGILGSVIANWSFAWVMWLSVIPQMICLGISFFMIEPKVVGNIEVNVLAHLQESVQLFIQNPKLRLLTLASTIASSAGEAIYLFNATFIQSVWPVWAIGIAKAMSNGGAAVSFLTAGTLIKRFGEVPILLWSRVYGRIVSVIAYVFPTVVSPILLSSHSLLYGTITVADSALKQREFSVKQRATMGSLDSLATALAMGVMFVLVGWLGDRIGVIGALLVMQIFQALPIGLYWRLWSKK